METHIFLPNGDVKLRVHADGGFVPRLITEAVAHPSSQTTITVIIFCTVPEYLQCH